MSSFRNITIMCPNCKTEGAYTIWDSVNVDLDPEMKSKVMDGSLFEWVCPNCKTSFHAPYSFLYHDMTHHFMIQFDAQRSHIIPFGEFIRIKENGLDMNAVSKLAATYRDCHTKKNILFDSLSDDNSLVFTVLEMPVDTWVITEQKYIITHEEYLQAINHCTTK